MSVAVLRRVVLYSRDVERSASWYAALGLRITAHALPSYARLEGGGGLSIDVQQTDNEATLSVGYAPLLCFEVAAGLDSIVPALLTAGGRLDGAIAHTEQAQVVCMRSPDGHMISIMERQEEGQGAKEGGTLR